ncbi:alpha-hydroxy acid oxidase [Puniceibacterium sp. IMCC21224]|uniref:alpha-hydroxy acid oxidase n=1 Tax=Puniceibacterium sp. IMCC21224 TaxID=1618204 RepID=UPI00064E13FA|nr:alpha-hydroxy acid oxidase [Puniceibacterium sp. IMCC21224]KMK66649.1 alpha-hydroxyacid dehydrogenase, FMN-dependent L-lactate dehydrogenase [Puniceibacterium sp. IMCC21224]
MDANSRFPAISDLRAQARRRIPRFVWDYLDSGTGTEATLNRNRQALDQVRFVPSILHGEIAPDLTTPLLGEEYPLPFGVAPLGMSGLIWPDAERLLAQAATNARLPYTLSTVAAQTPETVGPLTGGKGWFQLYPPRDTEIRKDMLKRARDSGFSTLVLTVDVPVASRRERQLRSGLTQPPRLTPRLLAQVALRPAWALGTARIGMPHMRTLDTYSSDTGARDSTAHVGYLLRTSPDWDYLDWLREHWDGPLIVKGVLDPNDAPRLQAAGVDAIWVSNHSGRQFDAAPASIEALPLIRAQTTLPLIFDSGVTGGLDILRAIALGADFVMLGRPFHYALGALGRDGPAHLIDILQRDLVANLGQLGVAKPADLRGQAVTN